MKLILKDGTELKVGDAVVTFRGDRGTLDGWREPEWSGSTGRVYVKIKGINHEWFPAVINAKWTE